MIRINPLAIFTSLILAAGSIGLILPVAAAPSSPSTSVESPQAGASIPADVLAAILANQGGEKAEAEKEILRRHLGIGAVTADETARRAADLIEAIGASRALLGEDRLLTVVRRITDIAIRAINTVPVLRMAIDRHYRAKGAVMALDFGAPGTTPKKGFTRVAPDDARLFGDQKTAHQLTKGFSLLADGISGIRRLKLRVPKGDYRLILMTRKIPLIKQATSFFGAEITVNGVSRRISNGEPADWVAALFLTGSEIGSAATKPGAAGIVTGDIARRVAELFESQGGGALVVRAVSGQGTVDIDLRDVGGGTTYLAGLVIEDASNASGFLLTDAAERALGAEENEAIIAIAAATVVQDIAPALGNETFPDDRSATSN